MTKTHKARPFDPHKFAARIDAGSHRRANRRSAFGGVNHRDARNHLVTRLLADGATRYNLGSFDQAADLFRAALRRLETSDNRPQLARCRLDLARCMRNLGDLVEAESLLESSLHSSRALEMPELTADILNELAAVHHYSGRPERTLELMFEILAIRQSFADTIGIGKTHNNIGIIFQDFGDYPQALQHFFSAYRLIQSTPQADQLAFHCLINIGNCHQMMERHAEGLTCFEQAMSLAGEGTNPLLSIIAGANLASAHQALGDLDRAVSGFQIVRTLCQAHGVARFESATNRALGEIATLRGDHALAETLYHDAIRIAHTSHDVLEHLEALVGLGTNALRSTQFEGARSTLLVALEMAEQAQLKRVQSKIHGLLCECFEAQQNDRNALVHHKNHLRLERELFNEASDRRAQFLRVEFETHKARQESEMYRLRNRAVAEANAMLEAKVQERTRALEAAHLETIERLAIAAEYRDDDTGQHTLRVGQMCGRIARTLGWEEDRIALLQGAARLHDVGKIGIPDSILLKPGTYSPLEYEMMKSHTEIGASILSGGVSPLIRMAEIIAVSHHEHWDGGGYPQGLAGRMIPLEGRILAVADVFDALISARPYKPAWTEAEALAEIESQSGKQFDPFVVEAFLKVLDASV